MFKSSQFEKLLDKATSPLLLEPDWSVNVTVCDLIRQNDIPAKTAFSSLKKRLGNDNPHSVLYTLQLIETLTKNCGSPVHDAIGTADFMDSMKRLTENSSESVRRKALELIQSWARTFGKNNHEIREVYDDLCSDGVAFPEFRESDAMFSAETAPEWQEGDVCHRCKTAFTTFRRRHHCRNCGNSVCDKCCSKRSVIPRFGIEKEVRVCDPCYNTLSTGGSGAKPSTSPSSGGSVPSTGTTTKSEKSKQRHRSAKEREGGAPAASGQEEEERKKRERELELQEKEELELALALSASEAESKEKQRMRQLGYNAQAPTPSNQATGFAPSVASHAQPPQQPPQVYSQLDTSEMDPELARYLNRNYWEGRNALQEPMPGAFANIPQPGAPPYSSRSSVVGTAQSNASVLSSASMIDNSPVAPETPAMSSEALAQQQQKTEFLAALRSSIDIFVNRMRSNSLRNRSISMDNTVQTLFLTLNAMHPQLLHYVNGLEEQRTYHETLQDKLSQLREAREALNALRQDHAERRRQEELEAARQRQLVMQQKLYLMRQQKETYLQAQREVALQRLQDQQREMALRQEAQKQMQNQMAAAMWAQPGTQASYGPPPTGYYPPGQDAGPAYAPHMHHPGYMQSGAVPPGYGPGQPHMNYSNAQSYGGAVPPQQMQMPPAMYPPPGAPDSGAHYPPHQQAQPPSSQPQLPQQQPPQPQAPHEMKVEEEALISFD